MVFDWLGDDMFDSQFDQNAMMDHEGVQYIDVAGPHDSFLESHIFHNQTNSVSHFENGFNAGYSMKVGNIWEHHNSHGMVDATSYKSGNEIIHKDNYGEIIEREEQCGNFTLHKDGHGNVIGHTDQFGKRFDNFGKLISTKTKY